MLTEHRETSQLTSFQFAKDEKFHQDLQSKVAAVTAKISKWRRKVTEESKNLKFAQADVAMQLEQWKSFREEINT